MKIPIPLTLVAFAAPFLVAAAVLPQWQQQLESQLDKDKGCQVNFLSNIHLRIINGKETISARAHCTDKRAFDVSRLGPDQPYKIEECEITNAC